jgi:cytochrome c
MVERDVAKARNAMNLSKWEDRSAEERIDLLTKMRAEARSGLMPPRQYTLVHAGAKPSAAQLQEFIDWTRAERGRLRSRKNEKSMME